MSIMMGTTSGVEESYQRAQDMINQVTKNLKDGFEKTSTSFMQKSLAGHSKHSIHARLTRLYFEELSKVPHATPDSVLCNLENECDLLGRLVQREGLHTLIVNLYSGNKGYSLAVRNNNKNDFDKNSFAETQLMGYEQGELLSCIDNGQLPSSLAEQLEYTNSHLFYDGCIIAEVRDYRKNLFHGKAEVHHVLLKPTTQSILTDITTLTSDGDWSHEDRLLLESRLLQVTQGPLCLDPDPAPTIAAARVRSSRSICTDTTLQRQAKKFSQVTVNRKRKLEQLSSANDGITIQDLMQRVRVKRGQLLSTSCPAPQLISPPLLPPSSPIDVLTYAKAYERPRETKDCLPILIEEYILETERGQGRVYHIKLSILQRPSNSEYLGELYVDRDYREGERNGSACRFTLGTRVQANHYMQQFTEIFTEEGRKNVRIKHVVPGQPARVTCTPGLQRHQAAQAAQAALAAQIQAQNAAAQIISRAQGQLNNLGQVIKINDDQQVQVQPQVQVQQQNGVDDSQVNGSGILVFQKSVNNAQKVPVLQAALAAPSHGETSQDVGYKKHSNPAINALVTSLMNSAQQFQQNQQAAAAAAVLNNNNVNVLQQQIQVPQVSQVQVPQIQQQVPQVQVQQKNNNAAILSLLNSPNCNQQKTRRISLNASIPQRMLGTGNVITVPNTSGQVRVSFSSALTSQFAKQQQPVKATAVRLARVQDNTSALGLAMPGLHALLAGTPSADNPLPNINNASSLLERLTSQGSAPASPMTSPPPAAATQGVIQGVNLTSLPNTINGLQNVQVSFPGLSSPITMPINVSAATASVTPSGVIVSLPISSATNICTTVSSMVAATVAVTTAGAGSNPTVVIANPANTHLSLPIVGISAQIIPSGVKNITHQNIRNTSAVTLSQGGQAIQLVGSQRPRLNQLTRQVQANQVKSTVLPNQLVTVAKTVTASQLILSGNKQVLTPIMASKPVLMATQATPSSQAVPANKHTLLTKSLHARANVNNQIVNQQTQGINVASISQQQLQQIQQCLAAQQKAAVAASNSPNRSQIQSRNSASSTPGDESL
ncbi:GSCOCG00013367001-RA-CDS [Cotesia congregata]|uniref:Similar to SUPT20H: Transcription factor SPT20 homolog (Gallus gallus) n=1 Tax=Cotesia congregata TaxID=51543 RepID=A0A8J2E2J8_COTCN|nr:GSCOCG00013367001-RA-CDS [Cotesia congregata]CAG5075253.1 Similar to SUPT20H: Transcription factor SPT20 homolog (Gallus gallus) [Cotesia congregata]